MVKETPMMDEEVLKQQVSHLESTTDYHVEHRQPLHEPEPKLHLKTFLVLVAVAMLNFAQLYNILALGAFARNIAVPLGDSGKSVWLSQSVAVCTAVLAPIFSRGSDLFGRKYFVVFGCVAGFVGDLIVSRASSMNMAIAGAAISGISYGAQPLAYAIPSEIVQRKYRVIANLFANVAGGIGAVMSLLIGSTLMRNGHDERFRILFYISAAIYAVSALICQVFYSPPRLDSQVGTVSQRLGYMDWLGYGLFGGALTGITIGLTWGKNPYSWNSAHVLAPLLIGVGLVVVLIIHQWKFRPDGLFDRHIFSKSRNPAIAFIAVAIEGAGTAIYSTRLSHELPAQIAPRVIPLGFNPQYLGALIGGLAAQNYQLVQSIPGISPAIIGAAVTGLKMAFISATKFIWVFGLAVSVVGALICVFIQNLTLEYTAEIDHPVEKPEVEHNEFA
ncbi:hypothetical protein QFC19_004532 [Naganishia cerealis]|uniref:Uncharacterized protein n=1 Tax=Naganishia cerealis TaxID=610337 RepID=A0ACC2VVT4_9TREE|nr:hypothetical protein QFC19_004532 [Naganishia cerealis]